MMVLFHALSIFPSHLQKPTLLDSNDIIVDCAEGPSASFPLSHKGTDVDAKDFGVLQYFIVSETYGYSENSHQYTSSDFTIDPSSGLFPSRLK